MNYWRSSPSILLATLLRATGTILRPKVGKVTLVAQTVTRYGWGVQGLGMYARRSLRALWMMLGLLLVGVGVVGVVVPVLPSTVFFISAAACFARSSPRLEQWVLNLPQFGPLVRAYRAGLGIPRRIKLLIAPIITVTVLVSVLAVEPLLGKFVGSAAGAVGVWFVVWHTPTREQEVKMD